MPKRGRRVSERKRGKKMQLQQQETNYFEQMPDELVLKVLFRPRVSSLTLRRNVCAAQANTVCFTGWYGCVVACFTSQGTLPMCFVLRCLGSGLYSL